MFPFQSESIHKAWKDPFFLTKKALFVNFKTKLFKVIGAEMRDSCGSSGTGETPQRLRRGGSPPAPRKASTWRGNQPHRTTW
ncbi:hypothetical protein DOZ91_18110 [Peribacillus frigoritolerans]|nr:hypothetical protein DOZ91_18110 [Peribacillus frigoritolerans]